MSINNLSWLRRAPLLLAAAALAACSSDQQPAPVAQQPQAWTLVVSVSKTDAPIVDATRGVGTNDDGETLVSRWTAGTTVEVYDEEDNRVGTLLADASESGTTLLRGTITGASYTPGESTLTLYSPAKTLDYSGQTGTVSSISAKDYVTGTITVTSVNMRGNMMATTGCTFQRLQAFTKFTFDFAMKSLQITADGLVGSPLTVTAASETATYYVALRNTEPGVKKQYSFYGTSADGTTTFIGTKYGTLQHGDYGQTNVMLQPSIENGNTSTWGATPNEENLGDIYL